LTQRFILGEMAFGLLVGFVARKALGLGERPFGRVDRAGVVTASNVTSSGIGPLRWFLSA